LIDSGLVLETCVVVCSRSPFKRIQDLWREKSEKEQMTEIFCEIVSFSFNVARLDRELEIKAEEAMVETN
jgi:adenylylsulfate kinase-like enzyme